MSQFSLDWITLKQDFGSTDFPPVSEFRVADSDKIKGYMTYDQTTGDTLSAGMCPFKIRGSHDTSINIQIRGSQIRIDGNVGRFGRLDNLTGISSPDALIQEANNLLTSLHPDLPQFTKCTKLMFLEDSNDEKALKKTSDGAIIERLDICHNSNIGRYNVDDYLKSLAVLAYRNMKPKLFDNGKTIDWKKSQELNKASTHIYAKCYDKAHDILIHSLKKAQKKFCETSSEVLYLKSLYEYCREMGTTRHELEFKSKFLSKHNYRFYGLCDLNELKDIVLDFVDLDKKAGGNSMSYETLLDKLVSTGACKSFQAASTTMKYYNLWRLGQSFEKVSTRTYDTHRARLRKVGIDIATPFDQSKVVDLFVKETREIIRRPFVAPSWYRHHDATKLRSVS